MLFLLFFIFFYFFLSVFCYFYLSYCIVLFFSIIHFFCVEVIQPSPSEQHQPSPLLAGCVRLRGDQLCTPFSFFVVGRTPNGQLFLPLRAFFFLFFLELDLPGAGGIASNV